MTNAFEHLDLDHEQSATLSNILSVLFFFVQLGFLHILDLLLLALGHSGTSWTSCGVVIVTISVENSGAVMAN